MEQNTNVHSHHKNYTTSSSFWASFKSVHTNRRHKQAIYRRRVSSMRARTHRVSRGSAWKSSLCMVMFLGLKDKQTDITHDRSHRLGGGGVGGNKSLPRLCIWPLLTVPNCPEEFSLLDLTSKYKLTNILIPGFINGGARAYPKVWGRNRIAARSHTRSHLGAF